MLYTVVTLIMLLAMVVSIALIATIVKIGLGPYVKNRRQPLSTAQAMVVSKREEMGETFFHNFERRLGEAIDPSDTVRIEAVDWFATFKPDEGEEREFTISQPIYESLIVGDQGELTWRGNAFVRFALPGEDAGEPRTDKTVPHDWR
jgi:hypothetical protein